LHGYNPAVHILRGGLSSVGVVTWLLIGGRNANTSEMAQIRNIDDVGGQLISSMTDFLMDAVTGSGVRLESVVTGNGGNNSSEVLSLMGTYGSRLFQFCVDQQLLVFSSKNWPYYMMLELLKSFDG